MIGSRLGFVSTSGCGCPPVKILFRIDYFKFHLGGVSPADMALQRWLL